MDKIENSRSKFFNAVRQLVGEGPTQDHAQDLFLSIFEFYSNGGTNIFESLTETEKEEQLPTFSEAIRHAFSKMIEHREEAIMFIKSHIREVASAVVYFRVEVLTSILDIPMSTISYKYWKQLMDEGRLKIESKFRRNDKSRNQSNHPWWNPLDQDRSIYEELADEYALSD